VHLSFRFAGIYLSRRSWFSRSLSEVDRCEYERRWKPLDNPTFAVIYNWSNSVVSWWCFHIYALFACQLRQRYTIPSLMSRRGLGFRLGEVVSADKF
jgi:hypothetical protein